ncbi:MULTISPECIES: tRNA-uridine aminocarboxypropyltransferase [Nitrincola]|uniref:tRNA-uridine aminocarboxypropyltransferase n=1 Tax=Nitrincola nitratireducens TaxID=1229521 RepID=W9V2S7_9GAMM|nr:MULTISPECIES: DTW domain-containing protein [Nitrincola]EXJ10427.1 hypothetical protein D791_02491 [Nitrincola nitratireducens]
MHSQYPRKPFVARGSNVIRCDDCKLPAVACMCSDTLTSQASCDFWLLMHHDEFYKPTNTGRLIQRTFSSTQCSRWSRLEPTEDLISALADPEVSPCIVFPEAPDYADRMIKDLSELPNRPLFIIPDGTWRQARRIFRHSRYLDTLPVIEPTIAFDSRYSLRSSGEENHVCTAEVAAALLFQIGDAEAGNTLLQNFETFNQRYYASKGRNLNVKEDASKR